MSDKILNDAVEFQPDALEIQQERLPWWARYSVLLAALFFGGVLVWACVGRVDVIVQAGGKLVTDRQNIVMKPLERSVIREINVRVGEVVRKDQVLITFDPELNAAETERLVNELQALTAQFERLRAEFQGTAYVPPAKGNENTDWQLAIHRQRQQYFQEKMAYFAQNIAQLESSMRTSRDTLEKQTERLTAVQKIEKMFQDLHDKKATSLKELLEISITRMQMEAEVDQLRNSLIEQEHQKQGVLANRNSFVEEWRNNISEEMVKVRRDLISTTKEYQKMERLNSYVCLRSPCEAMVHEIAAFSAGSAVREAEALITLVPLDGKIELEAEVEPRDIGKVEVGSEVRVKLNAFPFQKHGTLDGRVRTLSEDTFQKQAGEGAEGGAKTYYRARITISGKLNNVKDSFRLIPGMEVQAEIKTGRRRIIEYLIYPLIKALDETAREP